MTPHNNRRAALVIGAGINGLSTALVLARRGWRVTVLADHFGAQTVSTVAGAVWEWPPSVCGRHHDQAVLARSADWAMTSYRRFAQLAANPHTGVSLRPAVFYFRHLVEDSPGELEKMRQVEQHVPGFIHDPALITAHGVNPEVGVVDAYSYLAPTVDTDRYLTWLSQQAHAAGVTITHHAVSGPLVTQEQQLCAEFSAEVIINCTGLGAVELAGDTTLDPHRGALLRVINDGTTMPRITAVHAVANDTGTDTQNMIFIVPRGQDRLLIGGLVQPGQWETNLTPHDRSVRDMLTRAEEFLPHLRDARPDAADPLRVGLRPFRTGGVRLEAQPGTQIVHNYGHGGAGVTLSWGCAEEVADIADSVAFQQISAEEATSQVEAIGSTR
ncbi:MAG: FAD-binding oxidoreductase [Actinomycetia bacterium]|nr:FAD-binding oxidoreductase [Actinomycetes bacterium]